MTPEVAQFIRFGRTISEHTVSATAVLTATTAARPPSSRCQHDRCSLCILRRVLLLLIPLSALSLDLRNSSCSSHQLWRWHHRIHRFAQLLHRNRSQRHVLLRLLDSDPTLLAALRPLASRQRAAQPLCLCPRPHVARTSTAWTKLFKCIRWTTRARLSMRGRCCPRR